MLVAMVGAGYVGLVSSAGFAEFGNSVICVDSDWERIDRLNRGDVPIYEPGLGELVQHHLDGGRLRFTHDLAEAVSRAEAIFIAVGTPARRGDGGADLTFVFDAARQIAAVAAPGAVVVTKSTVPVGTGRQVAKLLAELAPGKDLEVASNPEFLREGSAVEDFLRPDRVVLGAETNRAREVMHRLYRSLYLIETPIVTTDLETAELAKYAGNAFLALKITFINEIADLCERVGADVHDVARAMGLDRRIGGKFLHPGPGFGGSCFPKDTRALARTGIDYGASLRLVETVIDVNDTRKCEMANRVVAACDGSVTGKTIAVLGLTFKPNTDDMREAPALAILPALSAMGADIRAYDPAGMEHAADLLTGVTFCESAEAALAGAEAVVVLTEWNEFRALDPRRIATLMAGDIVVDLRNIFDPDSIGAAGLSYHGVGRGRHARRKALRLVAAE